MMCDSVMQFRLGKMVVQEFTVDLNKPLVFQVLICSLSVVFCE